MFAWTLFCLVSCLLMADASVQPRQELGVFRASCGSPGQLETFITYDLEDTNTFGNNPIFIITSTDSFSTDFIEADWNLTEPSGNSYYNDMNCTVQFRTGSQPLSISTYLDYMDLERNPQCTYDKLRFAGIDHCGRRRHAQGYSMVIPPNDTFTVLFTTDSTVRGRGFLMTIFFWPTNITTYRFPVVPPFEPDVVLFHENYQELHQSDYKDNTLPDNSWQTYYTTENPSWHRKFRASCGGPGQLETFITYDLEDTDTFGDNPNFIITSTDSFKIDFIEAHVNGSEPTGNRYYNNMNCTIQFRTGSKPLSISTYFTYMDVERNPQCTFDRLKIAGIDHCGTRTPSDLYYMVIPPNDTFTVLFTTDSTVTGSGFQMEIFFWPTNKEETYSFPVAPPFAPDRVYYEKYQQLNQSDYRDNTLPENSWQTYYTTERPVTKATKDSGSTAQPGNSATTDSGYIAQPGVAQNCRYVIQNAASYINSAIQTLTYGMSLLLNSLNG